MMIGLVTGEEEEGEEGGGGGGKSHCKVGTRWVRQICHECGRDYPNYEYAYLSRNGICRKYALFGIFLRRYDADKWDLTQTLRRYLPKNIARIANAVQCHN